MEIQIAIENIRKVLDTFVGTKQQHQILEQSLNTLIENLKKDETKKDS